VIEANLDLMVPPLGFSVERFWDVTLFQINRRLPSCLLARFFFFIPS
jgi:hypothetical protein